jgi:hypothetical protein
MKSSAVKSATMEATAAARRRFERHERNDRHCGQSDEYFSEHETLPDWGRCYECFFLNGKAAAQLEASCSRRPPEMQNSVITRERAVAAFGFFSSGRASTPGLAYSPVGVVGEPSSSAPEKILNESRQR